MLCALPAKLPNNLHTKLMLHRSCFALPCMPPPDLLQPQRPPSRKPYSSPARHHLQFSLPLPDSEPSHPKSGSFLHMSELNAEAHSLRSRPLPYDGTSRCTATFLSSSPSEAAFICSMMEKHLLDLACSALLVRPRFRWLCTSGKRSFPAPQSVRRPRWHSTSPRHDLR